MHRDQADELLTEVPELSRWPLFTTFVLEAAMPQHNYIPRTRYETCELPGFPMSCVVP
jgi:hypothetical protein